MELRKQEQLFGIILLCFAALWFGGACWTTYVAAVCLAGNPELTPKQLQEKSFLGVLLGLVGVAFLVPAGIAIARSGLSLLRPENKSSKTSLAERE